MLVNKLIPSCIIKKGNQTSLIKQTLAAVHRIFRTSVVKDRLLNGEIFPYLRVKPTIMI